MSAQQNHTVWTAFLAAGTVTAGQVVVLNAAGTGYLVATAANLATAGRRAAGMAKTSTDSVTDPAFELHVVGVVDPTVANVGAGPANESVRVSATGTLERVLSPGGSDQVVGICDADGQCYINFGSSNATGGGGGSTSPGGSSGQLQYNNAGVFGGLPWTFDGTNVVAGVNTPLQVTTAAGTGKWDVAIREGSGAGETITFNGNAAGTATASAPGAALSATAQANLAISDGSAFYTVFSSAIGGVAGARVLPNLAVGTFTLGSTMYGGGTGVLFLKTTVEPPVGTPPAVTGAVLWHDLTTSQLLSNTKLAAGGDMVPITPIYGTVSFGSDANANLTTAQARATHLVVGSGTITATRKLTNTSMPPSTAHAVVVVNNNAQSVQYAWSSGTAVAIATGATAIVSGDGTNAVLVSSLTSGGSGVTWANDLAGSSNTHQWVAAISGSGGGGGTVAIVGGVTLQFGSAGGGVINVATVGSGTGTGLTVQSGGSSSGAGGGIDIKSGAGTSGAGNVNLSTGATLRLQLSDSGAAGDLLIRGANTFVSTPKGSNSTALTTSSGGVVQWDFIRPAMITAGTSGQIFVTDAVPSAGWGNVVSYIAANATSAASGLVRQSNTGTVAAVRDSGNTKDLIVCAVASDNITFGIDTANTNASAFTNIKVWCSTGGSVQLGTSAGVYLNVASSALNARVNMTFAGTVGGEAVLSTPFHWASASVTAGGSGYTTLSAAQYACPNLIISGAAPGSGATGITVPGTSGSFFMVTNNLGSSYVLGVGHSGASDVIVPWQKSAPCVYDATNSTYRSSV